MSQNLSMVNREILANDIALVTIDDLARKVNNVSLDEEIVVVEDWCPSSGKAILPAPDRRVVDNSLHGW